MNSIVKLSNNDSWYFYHNTSNGICFSKMDSHGIMGDSSILSADSPDDFDVICDEKDNIHMCCQSGSGDILYFRYKNNTWNKTILLKSKSNSTKKKHFRLFSINGWINIMCILEYRGKNMLTHHIPERNAGEPEVVDYIGASYTVSTDPYGNIHVFYDSEINSSFGFKTYLWSKKKWSDFNATPQYDNFDTMLTAYDSEGTLKISASKNKEIHFMSEDTDVIISTGESPVIYRISNTYIIQWTYKEKVYSAISRNNCKKWEKSGEYTLSKKSDSEIYRISCNNTNISADYCYGYRNADKIILLGLENLAYGNDVQIENETEYSTERTGNSEESTDNYIADNYISEEPKEVIPQIQYMQTEEKTADYSIPLNKIIITLSSAADTLSKIEKKVALCELRLENIENNITKELPEGSSKKKKFIRG